jgi:hypothetical protein
VKGEREGLGHDPVEAYDRNPNSEGVSLLQIQNLIRGSIELLGHDSHILPILELYAFSVLLSLVESPLYQLGVTSFGVRRTVNLPYWLKAVTVSTVSY